MEAAFTVGDRAVYPIHGVAEVIAMENRSIGGHSLRVYILKVLENGSTIVVPMANAHSVGLRRIISQKEVDEVFAILRDRDVVHNDQTWNRRQREYMDKLRTGSLFETAEVFRDLSLLGECKQLSFSERRLLGTAKNLLVQELAIARGASQTEVADELDSMFEEVAA